MAGKGIFHDGWQRWVAGDVEFAAFRRTVEVTLEAVTPKTAGLPELQKAFGWRVEIDRNAIRLSLGQRPTGRKDLEGNWASERGGTLIYSLAPTGDIVVAITPCASSLHRGPEEYVFLKVGPLSAAKLRRRLKKNLRDFVAYTTVTGLDTSPTWWQWGRVWWLRKTGSTQVDGKFESGSAKLFAAAGKATAYSLMTAIFGAFARMLAIIVVVWVLLYLEKTEWIPRIIGR